MRAGHGTASTRKNRFRGTRSFGPFLLLIAVLASTSQTKSAERATYLIIERPYELAIYNKYEQTLPPAGRDMLTEWMPFQLIEENGLLGDQITQADHVRYGNEDYYFLRDEDGVLIGKSKAGRITKLHNCEPLNDTVTVSRNGAITITFVKTGVRTSLTKGASIARFMRHSKGSYCLRVGNETDFGWCTGASSAFVSQEDNAGEENDGIPREIASRLVRRFEQANRSYSDYFNYFNEKTGQRKSAPRWAIEESRELLRFSLRASAGTNLKQSTKVLVRDIRDMVTGRDLLVFWENSTVEIRAGGE